MHPLEAFKVYTHAIFPIALLHFTRVKGVRTCALPKDYIVDYSQSDTVQLKRTKKIAMHVDCHNHITEQCQPIVLDIKLCQLVSGCFILRI